MSKRLNKQIDRIMINCGVQYATGRHFFCSDAGVAFGALLAFTEKHDIYFSLTRYTKSCRPPHRVSFKVLIWGHLDDDAKGRALTPALAICRAIVAADKAMEANND